MTPVGGGGGLTAAQLHYEQASAPSGVAVGTYWTNTIDAEGRRTYRYDGANTVDTPAIGWAPIGAGADAGGSGEMVYDIRDFGATEGASDHIVALEAAHAALPLRGAELYIPFPELRLSRTFVHRKGFIRGRGTDTPVFKNNTYAPTKILWTGAADGTVWRVQPATASFAPAAINVTTDTITLPSGHGFQNGMVVEFYCSAATTSVGSQNLASLPGSVFDVASTTSFPASGNFTVNGQTITYATKHANGTRFEGCSAGTGTATNGAVVSGTPPSLQAAFVKNAQPTSIQLTLTANDPVGGTTHNLQGQGVGTHTILQRMLSWGLDGLSIDGAGTGATPALTAWEFQRAQGGSVGYIGASNLKPIGGTAYDLNTDGSTAQMSASANTMYNDFKQLTFKADIAMKNRGSEALGHLTNTCHNRIGMLVGLAGHVGGVSEVDTGVQLLFSDNNYFDFVYVFMLGAGQGFDFGAGARSIEVGHLQSGNGWIARTPANAGDGNKIAWFDTENGRVAPIIKSGANIEWDEPGRLGTGFARVVNGVYVEQRKPTGEFVIAGPLTVTGTASGYVDLAPLAAHPGNPAAGVARIYALASTNQVYVKYSSGGAIPLGP